jgi:hypothetical protein
MDVIRGTGVYLRSDLTNAESTNANVITSFDSNGFTLGTSSALNGSTNSYAAWCWDAGSSTVTNTQGSISSQVRANASAGFSIVTYTGNGSSGQSVGHGLGVTPGMFIIKTRSDAEDWIVWHQSVTGATPPYGKLNTTQAFGTSSDQLPSLPTSTIINLGNSTGGATNTSGRTYVCYAFAPVAGYSSMGSFTTSSASTDGVFVYTNHRPRWVLIKETSATGPWIIYDAVRNTYNAANNELRPNTSEAENGGAYLGQIDILSNGFKIRSNSSAYVGEAGDFIYCSFAESPFAANNRAR